MQAGMLAGVQGWVLLQHARRLGPSNPSWPPMLEGTVKWPTALRGYTSKSSFLENWVGLT